MSPDDPSQSATARRVAVPYRFRGARAEFDEAFAVPEFEHKVAEGVVSVRRLGIGGGPGVVLLTEKRLCLLVHYVFRPDQGFEFPRGSLEKISPIRMIPAIKFYRLAFRTDDGMSQIDIADASVRPLATAAMGPTLRIMQLFEALRSSWGDDAPDMPTEGG